MPTSVWRRKRCSDRTIHRRASRHSARLKGYLLRGEGCWSDMQDRTALLVALDNRQEAVVDYLLEEWERRPVSTLHGTDADCPGTWYMRDMLLTILSISLDESKFLPPANHLLQRSLDRRPQISLPPISRSRHLERSSCGTCRKDHVTRTSRLPWNCCAGSKNTRRRLNVVGKPLEALTGLKQPLRSGFSSKEAWGMWHITCTNRLYRKKAQRP